ncbi:hypothetical protein ACWEFJ_21985 [Actinosynnema sp. NPDC004786]
MLRTALGVATGLVSGVLALPRIADALEALTDLRGTLERLEQLATFLANELPEALHQLEEVQRRLTELEPELAGLTGNTGHLDESIRVLAATLGPLQGATERLGRLVDRKRRTPGLPG